jgi:hypothetical protein
VRGSGEKEERERGGGGRGGREREGRGRKGREGEGEGRGRKGREGRREGGALLDLFCFPSSPPSPLFFLLLSIFLPPFPLSLQLLQTTPVVWVELL